MVAVLPLFGVVVDGLHIVFFPPSTTPRPSCTTHELTPSLVTRTADYCRWAGFLLTMSQVALTNALPITNSGFRSSFHSVPASTLFLLCSSFHRDPTRVFRPTQSCPHRSSGLQGSRHSSFNVSGGPCIFRLDKLIY